MIHERQICLLNEEPAKFLFKKIKSAFLLLKWQQQSMSGVSIQAFYLDTTWNIRWIIY